ncbi:MAG: hypothetical protein QOE96_3707 [Blastocatellia bacterium]|nr:hypothetical protein [Blastocatellia bacterium]
MNVRVDAYDLLRPPVELTGRRESNHPPPHQVSYETRSRRSRPTICWAAVTFAEQVPVRREDVSHPGETSKNRCERQRYVHSRS